VGKKVFYGWWNVAAMLPAMLVHAGAAFYVFGIFYKPLFTEFGWNRVQVAGAITIYLLTVGFSSPLIGRLADLYRPKKVIVIGAVSAGIAFALLSRISSLWQFYLLYFVLGLSLSACGAVPVNTVVTNWFTRKRGTAIGIAMAGVSLGAFTITPAGAYVLAWAGWRDTYLFLAAVTVVLVLPPMLIAMRNTPQEMGLLPDGDIPGSAMPNPAAAGHKPIPHETGAEWTLATASRTAAFWLICLSFYLIYFGVGAVLQHQIMFLTDMGVPLTEAAVALGVTGLIGGLGKIVMGLICDRFSPRRVTAFCFALQAFGIIILLFAKSMAVVWIFAVVFGFAMGGQLALQPIIAGYFFGLRSFGTIYGIILMAGAMGTATGPIIAAMIYDTAGSYFYAFSGCLAAALLASITVFVIRRPVPAVVYERQ
jgi:sugar phosphate permease